VDDPVWLNRVIVEAIHADQVREHGGKAGLGDEGLLESALARPRHVWSYDSEAGLPGSRPGTDSAWRGTMHFWMGTSGRCS